MKVACMTARHVPRVLVVNVFPPPLFLEGSFFERKDDCRFTEFELCEWIAYVSPQLPAMFNILIWKQKPLNSSHKFTAQYTTDFDTFRRHLERLIIVSAPVLTFLSDVQHIYRLKDPIRTGRWMALYFLLWYISHLVTFFVDDFLSISISEVIQLS